MNNPVGIKMKPLTHSDRCDRCGGQAYVKIGMLHGDLLFCAHDWRKNEEAAIKQAHGVQDERDKLYRGSLS